jgi:hypothetical protein
VASRASRPGSTIASIRGRWLRNKSSSAGRNSFDDQIHRRFSHWASQPLASSRAGLRRLPRVREH